MSEHDTGRDDPPSSRFALPLPGRGRLPTGVRVVIVVAAVFICGLIASRPAPPEQHGPTQAPATQRAETALLHPHSADPASQFPADFAAVMGYQPVNQRFDDGTVRAVNPDGGCSSPDGGGEFGFTPACKAHDLGYDLLRYADRTGHPLTQQARQDIDSKLATDLRTQCRAQGPGKRNTCETIADTYSVGLSFNSWRQQYGPPSWEPVAAWSAGLAAVAGLLVARRPGQTHRFRRGRATQATAHVDAGATAHVDAGGVAAPGTTATPGRRWLGMVTRGMFGQRFGSGADPPGVERYAHFLRVISLVLGVVGYWLAALLHPRLLEGNPGLSMANWIVQAVPVFFFAGGCSHLSVWNRMRSDGGGYVAFLSGQMTRLLRPVLAFVLVWLMVPVLLGMLGVPESQADALGRLVAQPLWFLALYLLVVAVTPVTALLHRHLGMAALPVLLAGIAGSAAAGTALDRAAFSYCALVLLAVLLQQVGFWHVSGGLSRASRGTLSLLGLAGLAVLPMMLSSGRYPALLGSAVAPASMQETVLATLAVFGLGAVQIAVVLLLREPLTRWLARHRPWSAVTTMAARPLTLYLWHAVGLFALLLGLRAAGVRLPGLAVEGLNVDVWQDPRPAVVLGILVLAGFATARFERPTPGGGALSPVESVRGRLAATIGVGYGAISLLGFMLTGFTRQPWAEAATVLPVDLVQNLVHLLLGVYLVRAAHAGVAGRRGPWVLCALAAAAPLVAPHVNTVSLVLHASTIVLAAVIALLPRTGGRARVHARPDEPTWGTPLSA